MKKSILTMVLIFLVFVPSFSQEVEMADAWIELRAIMERGLEGMDQSDEALALLEEQIDQLTAVNQSQRDLLARARETIAELRRQNAEAKASVEIAMDRMQDAEDVAAWWIADVELRMAELIRKNEAINRAHKNAWIGGIILGSGFSATGYWTADGIINNRYTPWSAAPALGSGAIWAIGHYIFKIW